jgi:hypothetical protein
MLGMLNGVIENAEREIARVQDPLTRELLAVRVGGVRAVKQGMEESLATMDEAYGVTEEEQETIKCQTDICARLVMEHLAKKRA